MNKIGQIPPNSTLIYELELFEIYEKKKPVLETLKEGDGKSFPEEG